MEGEAVSRRNVYPIGPEDVNPEEEKLLSTYLDFLNEVAQDDVEGLEKAEESYGDSWKKRGGVGAFMMLARKWDRIEKQVEKRLIPAPTGALDSGVDAYDIFAHMRADERPEGLRDDVRDLRRYLLLCEAEVKSAVKGSYLDQLKEIAEEDVATIRVIEEPSFKKRGGVGAFFKAASHWDVIEFQMEQEPKWDILNHLRATPPFGFQVRWLRRYLLLIEAEMRSRA